MSKIERVDVSRFLLDIHRDLSVSTRARKPGPPERMDGMTVGIQMITGDAPHGGEMHPDGDEILYVVSGRFRVTGDSEPDAPVELGSGEVCVVRKGEWHLVTVVEPGQLVHITPGPRGEHRRWHGPPPRWIGLHPRRCRLPRCRAARGRDGRSQAGVPSLAARSDH